MRVVRGRERTPAADRDRSRGLLEWAGERREPAVRVWRPHRQVAFGRRDRRSQGFDAAREAAQVHGFPGVERDVGGRAVAYTGTTLAFARFEPVADPRNGLQDRYDRVDSLQDDGKIVGIAQRVTASAALTAGVLLVADHDEVATVLESVYEALEVPFDPATVGSVARSGGDVDRVRDELEAALVGDDTVHVETIRGG